MVQLYLTCSLFNNLLFFLQVRNTFLNIIMASECGQKEKCKISKISYVSLISNIDELTWVATHHLVDLDLFTF